jgi:hypothetical protein
MELKSIALGCSLWLGYGLAGFDLRFGKDRNIEVEIEVGNKVEKS